MYKIVEKVYGEAYPDSQDNKFLKAIKYVLSKNVIHGDGLTGLRENAEGAPIIFSEWEMNSSNVVRKDFTMNDMVAHGKRAAINEEKSKAGGNSLFGLANMVQVEEKLNPINKYKPTYFKEVFKLE
ncbi:MAG TPA: hypothetical protein GXZ90_05385 [Clostridiales bacterium]|nr:hypothetical protein [Clostridiales bacterium]